MHADSSARLWPLTILAWACSAGGAATDDEANDLAEASTGWDTAAGADAEGGGSSDDSGAPLAAAAWWSLEADLVVADGVAISDGSVLRVVSLDADRVVRCVAEAPIDRVTALAAPEPELLAWWQVIAGDWTGGDCADVGVEVTVQGLQLGVGDLHPEIAAVLATVDEAGAGAGDSLNGAYARLETGSAVYVFGVAGQAEAYEGGGERALEAPLADGVWQIRPAYLFAADEGW